LQNDPAVVRKFFPLDKNYLLEAAQLELTDRLLSELLEHVKEAYELRNNPLGIVDEFFLRIRNYKADNFDSLKIFYQTLAGVYRYKFGDNQLEFMWDGVDQLERYKKEWSVFFADQSKNFCKNELFLKAVLDLTVFNNYSQLAENRMNNFMLQTFEVKLRNGLIKIA
jgi:hypothetical protein